MIRSLGFSLTASGSHRKEDKRLILLFLLPFLGQFAVAFACSITSINLPDNVILLLNYGRRHPDTSVIYLYSKTVSRPSYALMLLANLRTVAAVPLPMEKIPLSPNYDVESNGELTILDKTSNLFSHLVN